MQSLHCGWCMHAGQLPRQGQPTVSVKEGAGAAAGGRASSYGTASRSSATQATSSSHRALLHPSPATQLSSAPLHTSGCRGPHVQAHDCMCRHPSGHGHLAPGHVLLPKGKFRHCSPGKQPWQALQLCITWQRAVEVAQPACHRQLEQVGGITCRLPGRQCLASKCLPEPKVSRRSAVSGAHYTSLRCRCLPCAGCSKG